MSSRDHRTSGRKYETRDADFPRVMATAFSLVGVMVVGMVFAWAVYEIVRSQDAAPGGPAETFAVPDTLAQPPGPNLEADPSASLARLRAAEEKLLTGYGWTDSARGIARVPVARAMELYILQETRK